ncbi:unnamed protein product, partial [Adineta ricciae]
MKINLTKLINLLASTLLNLNIFPRRIFGGRITHHKAKYFGQLSTRLYIVLLIISMSILTFYNVIQSRIITNNFHKPSIDIYNDLLLSHSDTLQCRCSSISSTYNHFVQIQPIFHSICSSTRRFLYAHLQLLSGLCSEAIHSVNSYIAQLLSSFFLTDQLVSPITLQTRINTLVNSGQSNAPASFKSRLSLLRAINYGNAIVSAYGTNFEFFNPWVNETYSVAITQPIIYVDGCSCATSMNCTTQAGFIAKDSSTVIPVTGLKMGCTPSEALLSSTLECFYDLLCINLILQHTNNTNISSSLSTDTSRYLLNATVMELATNV